MTLAPGLLDPRKVVPYLLERGLLSAKSVVYGDLLVLDASRRNSNYKVIGAGGPSYMVKQGTDGERALGIANEYAIYKRITSSPGASYLARHVPQLYSYDAYRHVLVLELWPDALPVGEYHARTGRFSVRLAGAVGTVLSRLHGLPPVSVPVGGGVDLRECPAPWVLSAHRPDMALYRQMSNANLELITTMQRFPALGTLLEEVGAHWNPTSLVHYDVKLENLLVTGMPGRRSVKVVDWEMAGRGDPAWDVGSLMGEYLAAWLHSIPDYGDVPPSANIEQARFPLPKVQPCIRRFWQAYMDEAPLTGLGAVAFLRNAVGYAAARLVQSCFERNQVRARLAPGTLLFLQVALNMLQRPFEAATHLLGIPPQTDPTPYLPQAAEAVIAK